MSDKNIRERLAMAAYMAEHGDMSRWENYTCRDEYFALTDALLSEIAAAGYAVVPKAWLVGTKEEGS